MAKIIYKYKVSKGDNRIESFPSSGKVVHFGFDGEGELCIWVEHSTTDAAVKIFNCSVVFTGTEFSFSTKKHAGTTISNIGMVYHLYVS